MKNEKFALVRTACNKYIIAKEEEVKNNKIIFGTYVFSGVNKFYKRNLKEAVRRVSTLFKNEAGREYLFENYIPFYKDKKINDDKFGGCKYKYTFFKNLTIERN